MILADQVEKKIRFMLSELVVCEDLYEYFEDCIADIKDLLGNTPLPWVDFDPKDSSTWPSHRLRGNLPLKVMASKYVVDYGEGRYRVLSWYGDMGKQVLNDGKYHFGASTFQVKRYFRIEG